MAGQAQPGSKSELTEVPPSRDALMETAARLYGQGFRRGTVAQMMLNHLVPNGRHRTDAQRMPIARARLRKWERQQEFRDFLYIHAIQVLDLETPAILKGVANKAKRGRVDAARLALELTGRHNPKGEQAPAQVAVIIQGVPRPTVGTVSADGPITIEASEAMIGEDEDV